MIGVYKMYCKRCGRKLKTERSIKIGYGPVCFKKTFMKSSENQSDFDDFDTIYKEKSKTL